MPLYEYQCKKCKHKFEKIQKFSDRPIKKCPECGGAVEQLIHAPSVQFKGTGWYVTDYARKGGSTDSRSADSKSSEAADTASKAAEKSESKKSDSTKDSKTEAKTASKPEPKTESRSKKKSE